MPTAAGAAAAGLAAARWATSAAELAAVGNALAASTAAVTMA
jgi:hypothetical protein